MGSTQATGEGSDGDDSGGAERSQGVSSLDPQLERQVETIRNLVDSYMRIVTKTFRDLVPKIIMHLTINNAKDYIFGELLGTLYAAGDQNQMMEESPEEERRREELLRMYHASKEALRIIGDVSMATTYTAAPPPVKNNWTPSQDSGFSSSNSMPPSQPRASPTPPPSGGSMNRGAPPPRGPAGPPGGPPTGARGVPQLPPQRAAPRAPGMAPPLLPA